MPDLNTLNLNKKDQNGNTRLHEMFNEFNDEKNLPDLKQIKILLAQGADPSITDSSNENCLDLAIQGINIYEKKTAYLAAMLLIECGYIEMNKTLAMNMLENTELKTFNENNVHYNSLILTCLYNVMKNNFHELKKFKHLHPKYVEIYNALEKMYAEHKNFSLPHFLKKLSAKTIAPVILENSIENEIKKRFVSFILSEKQHAEENNRKSLIKPLLQTVASHCKSKHILFALSRETFSEELQKEKRELMINNFKK